VYTTLIDEAIANWVHRDLNFAMVKILLDEQALTDVDAYTNKIVGHWKYARRTWDDVICLELYHEAEHDEGFGNGAEALFLHKKADEEGVYTRIGTMSYGLVSWFQEHGVEDVVTIV
jgi:hypothetical protein